MDGITGTVVTGCGMFAGTNVDDIIILTVLFLSGRANGRPRAWRIWTGQYTGIAALVVIFSPDTKTETLDLPTAVQGPAREANPS